MSLFSSYSVTLRDPPHQARAAQRKRSSHLPNLTKTTNRLQLPHTNHRISSLSEVSRGTMNILRQLARPQELGWINPEGCSESSGESSELPKFARTNSRPCSYQSLLPSKLVTSTRFPQILLVTEQVCPIQHHISKTRDVTYKGRDFCLKGEGRLWLYLMLPSKTCLWLQGWNSPYLSDTTLTWGFTVSMKSSLLLLKNCRCKLRKAQKAGFQASGFQTANLP